MDKASIIKDAIEYIQELHKQEKTIQTEIMELESGKQNKIPGVGYEYEQELPMLLRSNKTKLDNIFDSGSGGSITSTPVEVLEVLIL